MRKSTATHVPAAPDPAASEAPHLALGDLLELRHQYFPGEIAKYLPMTGNASGPDSCRVVPRKGIQPFRFEEPSGWADYEALCDAFKEYNRSHRTHNSPYKIEEIFAPVKVVVAGDSRRIRAVLTFDPIFPPRGLLATLQPGRSLAAAYAAVAVLNSSRGLAEYRDLFDRAGKAAPGASDGLRMEMLRQLPIARNEESLDRTADLSYRLATLWEAAADCGAAFDATAEALESDLDAAVSRLLGREPAGEEGCAVEVALLSAETRRRADQLAVMSRRRELSKRERKEMNDLNRVRGWENRLNSPRPAEIRIEPWPEESPDRRAAERTSGLSRAAELVREPVGGKPYEYFRISDQIVSAPAVCGGRPTFKYTRIDVRHVVDDLVAGVSVNAISAQYGGLVTREALDEARRLVETEGWQVLDHPFLPAAVNL